MVALICLSCLGYLTLQDGLITAEGEAQVLSAKIGKPIQVARALSKQILYVRRGTARPEDELAACLSALHASVVPEQDKLIVRQTQKDVARLRQARATERERWIQGALHEAKRYSESTSGSGLDRFLSQVSADDRALKDWMSDKGPVPSKVIGPMQLLPAQALLQGILARVGLGEVAAIATYRSLVFESRPAGNARQLVDVSDLVDEYKSELAALGPIRLTEQQRAQFSKVRGERILAESQLRDASVSDVRFRAEATPDAIWVRLELFDQEGRSIDYSDLLVRKSGRMITSQAVLMETLKNASNIAVPVPTGIKDAVAFLRTPKPPLPAWFRRPDVTEPLSLLVKPLIEELVSHDTEPCSVVYASDKWFSLAFDCVQDGKINLTAFKTDLTEWSDFEHIDKASYSVWRPMDVEDEDASRIDRRELARFVSAFQTDTWVKAEVVAPLIHDHYPARCALLGDWWVKAQLSAPRGSAVGQGNLAVSMFNLLGAISPVDLERLRSGSAMTANELGVTPEVSAVFEEDSLRSEGSSNIPDRYQHPYELFPSADVGAVQIVLNYSNAKVLKAWMKGDKEPPEIWQAATGLPGMFRASAKPSPSGPLVVISRDQAEADWSAKFSFRLADRASAELRIGLPRGFFLRGWLPQGTENETAIMCYADLSQEVKDEIWKDACVQAINEEVTAEKLAAGQGSTSGKG